MSNAPKKDALTPEELKELTELAQEEAARHEAREVARRRRHLDALRLSKQLAHSDPGVPGRDYVVVETEVGVWAFRRPSDVEVDAIEEDSERAEIEKFISGLVIATSQNSPEFKAMLGQYVGLGQACVVRVMSMVKVVRDEEPKK